MYSYNAQTTARKYMKLKILCLNIFMFLSVGSFVQYCGSKNVRKNMSCRKLNERFKILAFISDFAEVISCIVFIKTSEGNIQELKI
jgi:hypothetical protein